MGKETKRGVGGDSVDRRNRQQPALTGRESLIRLIGKRRRTLSSSPLLLKNYKVEGTLQKEEELSDRITFTSDSDLNSNLDLVACPISEKRVCAMDYTGNSHPGVCITRGKRQLTQSTLLKFRLGSRPNDKNTFPVTADYLEGCERQMKSDDKYESSTVLLSTDIDSDGNNRRNECNSEKMSCSTPVESAMEHLNRGVISNLKEENICSTYASSPDDKMAKLDSSRDGVENILPTLKTFIVGRKFAEEFEVKEGTTISLLRDPNNVKDADAIKVVHKDSEFQLTLGFLPREMAKCLSILLDKYNLKLKVSITALPRHPLDAIPIQLVCDEIVTFNEKESDHKLLLLWENAARMSESFSPSTTKYQQNFNLMIQEVLKHHSHLFAQDEMPFLESFSSLSNDAQRLFVRLYTRKGPWFRISSMSYPEITDLQQAVEELCKAGFMVSFPFAKNPSKVDVMEVLDLLTVSELREISSFLHLKKGIHTMRKKEIIGSLFASFEVEQRPDLVKLITERTGTCARISSTADFLFWRTQRLFFLNGEQDLSSFLLVDLGVIKYPSYTCIISQHVFSTRSSLLAYEEAIEVAQTMDQSLEENDVGMVIRCIEVAHDYISDDINIIHSSGEKFDSVFLSHFSAPWVYSKVVTLGISFYEHERRYDEAIMLLKKLLARFNSDGRRGYWTLRLSIDLEHKGYIDESLSVAEKGVLDPWVRAGSKMALQRRVVRLGKPPRRWKRPSFAESINRKINEVHVRGRPLNCEIGMKNRYYGDDGEQCSVEQLALQYYAGEGGGWKGVHAESGIWMTIFGLLMWDIIFADVPDVFHNNFQTAPLDLGTECFYTARKGIIESRLSKISSGLADEILMDSWESHFGTSCRCVNWERHSLPDLLAVVSCVSSSCLASLCRHLAQDYRSWSSGMPDLLLWRFSDDFGRGEAKLVEVKGPRDRLSEQQWAWLLLLLDCGFNVEVCKVIPMPIDD